MTVAVFKGEYFSSCLNSIAIYLVAVRYRTGVYENVRKFAERHSDSFLLSLFRK